MGYQHPELEMHLTDRSEQETKSGNICWANSWAINLVDAIQNDKSERISHYKIVSICGYVSTFVLGKVRCVSILIERF